MASEVMDFGSGTTMAMAGSSYDAKVLSVTGSDITRASVDSTHMGSTGAKKKIFADLYDPGTLEFEIAFDPDHANNIKTDMTAAVRTMTLTFPIVAGESTGAKVVGTGAVTSYSYAVPMDDKMTSTFTWEWDGETGPNWTSGS